MNAARRVTSAIQVSHLVRSSSTELSLIHELTFDEFDEDNA